MLVFCEHVPACLAYAIDFKQGKYLCAEHYMQTFGEPSPNLELVRTSGRTAFSKEQLAHFYFERLRAKITPAEEKESESIEHVLAYEQSFQFRKPPQSLAWYNNEN